MTQRWESSVRVPCDPWENSAVVDSTAAVLLIWTRDPLAVNSLRVWSTRSVSRPRLGIRCSSRMPTESYMKNSTFYSSDVLPLLQWLQKRSWKTECSVWDCVWTLQHIFTCDENVSERHSGRRSLGWVWGSSPTVTVSAFEERVSHFPMYFLHMENGTWYNCVIGK